MGSRLLSFFLALSLLNFHSSAADVALFPQQVLFSSEHFGSDGPWQAVEVQVGTPAQTVALFPGNNFQTHLLTIDVCKQSTICNAQKSGLYSPESSSTSDETSIAFPGTNDIFQGSLKIEATPGKSAMDTVQFGGISVQNVSIDIHSQLSVIYPDGATFPAELGTFALGFSNTVNQTFDNVNATLISGYLASDQASRFHTSPSNSFGLHIGSVSPSVSGSLFFGGYDQARVLGEVSTQSDAPGTIDLLDISINVIDGASPWNSSTKFGGLLKSGNNSIGAALPVDILPHAPYLNLPQSTCRNIASRLPVTYSETLGLYTWNADDPNYKRIVSSASVLSFTFRKDQLNTQNITINVPFMLLNLTLTAPLVDTPTPYFPCNAQSYGHYSLGRAFLQAAFFGTNWNSGPKSTWWLAQAPGPGLATQPAILPIKRGDTKIVPSGNDWVLSWKDTWTPLAAILANVAVMNVTSTAATTASSSETATSSPSSGVGSSVQAVGSAEGDLSVGAKAGIAVGVIVAVIAIFAVGYLALRQHRAKQAASLTASALPFEPGQEEHRAYNEHGQRYASAGYGPAEVEGGRPVVELSQDGMRGESAQNRKPVELGSTMKELPLIYELPAANGRGRYC